MYKIILLFIIPLLSLGQASLFSLSKEKLNHNPRPVEETIQDTIEFFQKRGLIN